MQQKKKANALIVNKKQTLALFVYNTQLPLLTKT